MWMEAAAIGLIGLALGLMLGAAQLYYTRRDCAAGFDRDRDLDTFIHS